LGCPAIDKDAGQPNVFFDPKSSESAAPYFSTGARADLIQRRYLEAQLNLWRDGDNNPAGMVDAANIYAWCWDARPYPEFPALADVWGDAANYVTGHWLNGRLGTVALADLVMALCADAGFSTIDVSGLDGLVTGYAVTDVMSPRDALTPLATAFFFDAVESEGVLRFVMRGRGDELAVVQDGLVLAGDDAAGFSLVRAQESDLPQVSRITYIDGDRDYAQASVEARRLTGASNRIASSSLPLVMDQAQAAGIGTRLLQDAWVMRESGTFTLPPSALALDAADTVMLTAGGRVYRLRLTQIDDGSGRAIEAVATDPSLYEVFSGPVRAPTLAQTVTQPGRPLLLFLDLPWLTEDQNTSAPFVAAYADPWPGPIAVMRSASDSGYALDATLTRPCSLGVTTADFYAGPPWHWDMVNSLRVKLTHGTLASASDLAVARGANVLAVQSADGGWEIVQFANATLTAPGEYMLTRLRRGRRGSETQMRSPVAAGARVVVLDAALVPLGLKTGEARLPFYYRWGPASKPISDVSWQGARLTFEAAALIPLAPCHVRASWNSGDIVIAWRRRDRDPAASSILPAATPLSETRELYDLEICSSGAVVRSFASIAQHSQTYTAAQQAADFPSGTPSPLEVNVYQRSSTVGRGRQKKEFIHVG
jgi:hypothetical protein